VRTEALPRARDIDHAAIDAMPARDSLWRER
jgi:hypothetical protein